MRQPTPLLSAVLLAVATVAAAEQPQPVIDTGAPFALASCQVIPAAARTTGSSLRYFATDLELTNLGSAPTALTVALMTRDEDNSTTSVAALPPLAPGATYSFEDAVPALFGSVWRSWYGALAVCAEHDGVAVWSRTYQLTTQPAATVGQGIPAVAADAGLQPGQVGHILGLREDAAYRSNLGLVNLGGEPVTVTFDLVGDDGAASVTVSQTIAPYSQVQHNRVLLHIGGGELARGRVEVQADGPIAAFASIVDNVSNDATWVAPVVRP